MTSGQSAARERLSARFVVPAVDAPLDLAAVFGRRAPVVVEIGFGMGEATAEMAAAQPDVDLLAVDVHAAGVGHLMRLLDERRLGNVRVVEGDAVHLLARAVPPRALAGVRVFFPDPWPKARHAKRRLVSPRFLDLVADRLATGGVLHVATDWAAYADTTRAAVAAHPAFAVAEVPWRPRTRYERRGLGAGRDSHDIAAVRR